MLPRAALRAVRPSSSPTCYSRPIPLPSRLSIRAFASAKRPPPPIPPARPSRPPPPPRPHPHPTTGAARQTSPGTSIPRDQTWKPKDGIRLGAPAAASEATTSAAAPAGSQTPLEGARPTDESARQDAPLVGDAQPQEPVAQQSNIDEPVPGSARDNAHTAQSAAENAEPPEQPEEPVKPQQPLPDLRQGIPSTFDFEFGGGKPSPKQTGTSGTAEEAEPDKFDLTSSPTEEQSRQRGERGERDYDRSAYETSLDRRRARVANWLYAIMLALATSGGLYLARPFNAREAVPAGLEPSDITGWSLPKLYARLRARLGNQLGYYTEPTFPKLLPEVPENQRPPYTLVLSLEDLMIHSSWDRENGYRTAKRPGIDYFIRYLSQYYELVLFTSAPMMMADPVMKKLDPYHFVMWNLGREATKYEGGEYIKDLSYLNRPLNKTIIIDTHAPHVKNQPENAIILPKWSGDPKDAHVKDLVALIPFLEYVGSMGIQDVRDVLASFAGTDIPTEFARREALAREKFLAELQASQSRRPRRSLGSLASGLGIKSSPAMAGGMMLPDGQSVAEGLAKGKMLSDQIREAGQRQYEHIEAQIREHGATWLKEEEEETKRLMEAQMKDMKKGAFSWFGGGGK